MSGGTSSDVFIPQVATDSIVAGISDEGVKVLYGSEAVNVSPTLGAQGMLKVGRKLTIPYFGMIPTWQDDVPEGASLQPDKASETVEEAPMKRTGVAIEYSTWEEMVLLGRSRNLEPYNLFTGQALERLGQRFEARLVTTAVTGLDSAYINEVPANASKTIDWDAIADTKQLLGDAAKKIVMLSCHSKVKTDLTKLKDATGRPLLVDATAGTAEIPRIQGLPLFESDFNVKSSDSPAKYDTLLLQRGALALWHSMPTVELYVDPRSGTKQIILWVYYIAYRYKSLPGGSKPGVLILRTR
jgi:hypothetical protein